LLRQVTTNDFSLIRSGRTVYQQMIDGMTTAGKIINDAKPSEALMEVHILFMYAQVVYTIRTLRAVKALECLRRGQFAEAASRARTL